MLFRVNSGLKDATGREFFELNPGAEAVAEFNKCTTRQMFFVCLVADRDSDSPLRTLPENARRTKAAEIVGYPTEDGKRLDKNGRNAVGGKVETIENAIIKYRELQYDETEDMLQAMDTQIQETLYMMKVNKEDLCTVETTSVAKDGTKTTKKSINGQMLIMLIKEAGKLAKELPALRAAKNELL